MWSPQEIMVRLQELEVELAERQNVTERSATEWFTVKRDKEKAYAVAFMQAQGPVDQRKAAATLATADIGKDAEASWEAARAVARMIETRVGIGQSLLRAHTRNGAL